MNSRATNAMILKALQSSCTNLDQEEFRVSTEVLDKFINHLAPKINLPDDPFAKKGLLSWLFWLVHKLQKVDGKLNLTNNSANCYFAIETLKNTGNGQEEDLFFKIVPVQTGVKKLDSIIVDNVNGMIINMLRKIASNNQEMQKTLGHYMTFRDSFLFYYNNKLNTIPVSNILSMYPPSSQEMTQCQVAVYEAIDGPSLMTLVKTSCRLVNTDSYKLSKIVDATKHLLLNIFKQANDILKSIYSMGSTYGMVHNDLHLGNILIDKHNNNNVVIIDYGRMFFQTYMPKQQDVIDATVNSIVQEQFYRMEPLYDLSIKKRYEDAALLNFYVKGPMTYEGKYITFITDYITFALNMYIFFLVTYKDFNGDGDLQQYRTDPSQFCYLLSYQSCIWNEVRKILNQVVEFKVVGQSFSEIATKMAARDITIVFPEKATLIQNYYKVCNTLKSELALFHEIIDGPGTDDHTMLLKAYAQEKQTIYQLIEHIAEGLFLFANILMYCDGEKHNLLTYNPNTKTYSVELKRCKIFHTHFQCRLNNSSLVDVFKKMAPDMDVTQTSKIWKKLNGGKNGGIKKRKVGGFTKNDTVFLPACSKEKTQQYLPDLFTEACKTPFCGLLENRDEYRPPYDTNDEVYEANPELTPVHIPRNIPQSGGIKQPSYVKMKKTGKVHKVYVIGKKKYINLKGQKVFLETIRGKYTIVTR